MYAPLILLSTGDIRSRDKQVSVSLFLSKMFLFQSHWNPEQDIVFLVSLFWYRPYIRQTIVASVILKKQKNPPSLNL